MNGDITGTGTVEIADALEVLKFLAGLDSVISVEQEADNAPSISDALEILKFLAGLPNMIIEK